MTISVKRKLFSKELNSIMHWLLLASFFLISSCVYDPPQKGKTITIHNQTDKPILVLDSLNGKYFKLYDTATVNGRKYISQQANYVSDHGIYFKFYSNPAMESLKSKKSNKIGLFVIEQNNLHNGPSTVFVSHLYRSFDISIDTLKKYELNDLLITKDSILFEHEYDYSSLRK